MTPRARREALVVQELEGETLVYDQRVHRAHCLNGTASEVFRLADGSRSVPEIAAVLGERLGCAEPDLVWAAVEELGRAELLEDPQRVPSGGRSRRAALKRLGLGLLVPTVISVLAPTPAEALGTCVDSCAGQPDFTVCSLSADCDIDSSGTCLSGACV